MDLHGDSSGSLNTRPLISAHQLLSRTHFYALCLCSAVACAFLAARIRMAHTHDYRFLSWNLFLAWIPYWCSVGVLFFADHSAPAPGRTIGISALAAAWLVFFPNAPYIVT